MAPGAARENGSECVSSSVRTARNLKYLQVVATGLSDDICFSFPKEDRVSLVGGRIDAAEERKKSCIIAIDEMVGSQVTGRRGVARMTARLHGRGGKCARRIKRWKITRTEAEKEIKKQCCDKGWEAVNVRHRVRQIKKKVYGDGGRLHD